jgi:hemolysin (HlyC) family protein
MTDDDASSSSFLGKTGWWARLFQGRLDEAKSREGIAEFLDECRQRNLLAADEHRMLIGVLQVSETHVREIMVPRSHMVVLSKDDSPVALLKTIVESGHSRFPVIGDDRDQVLGILLAKDLLKHVDTRGISFELEKLLRPAVFIPESKRLNTLLTEFRQLRNHMAIVVDEYGGVAGLATIEDVLEEIVGEIDDEHDAPETEHIQDLGDGRFLVLALARIEQFNEFFHAQLSDAEYETVGGLIMHQLGHLPRRAESLDFSGFRFRVLRADRRRIHSVEVTRLAPVETP